MLAFVIALALFVLIFLFNPVIGLIYLAFILMYVRIILQYERGVVFRLGRMTGIREPGCYS